MDKEYCQNCFIFDKFSKIRKIEDDFTIPGGEIIQEQMLHRLSFATFDQLPDLPAHNCVNFAAVVYKVGPVGSVTLKKGD